MNDNRMSIEKLESLCSIDRHNSAQIRKLWMDLDDIDSHVRYALSKASMRLPVLRFLLLSLREGHPQVFADDLFELASFGHSDVILVRRVIKIIPSEWIRRHAWSYIEPILLKGDEEEFRRMSELMLDIDKEVLSRIINVALSSNDDEINEVGHEFNSKL